MQSDTHPQGFLRTVPVTNLKLWAVIKVTLVSLLLLLAQMSPVGTTVPSALAASGGSSLQPGETLYDGQSLVNGQYTMALQSDGNFVLYAGNRALWQSGTSGRGGAWVSMQGDGNLVVYNSANQALWQSGTAGQGSSSFPNPVSLAPNVNPANFSTFNGCALYAQTRRPSLGPTGGGGGAADYISKFRSTVFQLSLQEPDLRTRLAPGYAAVWNRGDQRLSAAGKSSGHVAIVEEVGPDYVVVSQAGVGSRQYLTVYPTWSMHMRINKANLAGVYFIP